MPEKRRKFDREFREGAVRIVRETNKPIAQVAADLGIHAGTLANWVKQDKINRGESEGLSGDEPLRRLTCSNDFSSGTRLSRIAEFGLGNADAAASMLRRRLDRAVERGDTYARMRSLTGLARVAIGTVDEDLAPALLEEALHLARRLHDPAAEVDILGLSGAIERRHDLADTSDALTRAIFLARQHCPETLPSLHRLAE
jgi:transposase